MGGPYWYNSSLLMAKKWSSKIAVERDMLSSMFLWVHLRGIHEHVWSTEMLTRISSLFGKTLRMDQHTANGETQVYARVCIIIDYGEVES